MTKHNLICAKPILISLFGMLHYAGYTFGSFFLPNLSDKKGRRNFYLGSIIMQGISILLMNVLPYGYYNLVLACLFMIGISGSLRGPLQICMMLDVTPQKYHGILTALLYNGEAFTVITQTVYFSQISKNYIGP